MIEDSTGSELLSKLYTGGMNAADFAAQTLATGGASTFKNFANGLVAVTKALGDDFVRTFIKSYGDDAVKAIAAHGDDMGKLALHSTDDAAKLLLSSSDDVGKAALSYTDDAGSTLLSSGDNMIDDWYGIVDDTVDGAAKSWDDIANSIDDVADDALAGTHNTGYNGSAGAGNYITEIKYSTSSGAILKANPNKTTTILGSYENDMKYIIDEMGNMKSTYFGAQEGSFNVLNVPDELYDPDTFWDLYNKPWLNEAINRGDDIVLATIPEGKVMQTFNKLSGEWGPSGFAKEFQYLIDNGYHYDSITNMMIK